MNKTRNHDYPIRCRAYLLEEQHRYLAASDTAAQNGTMTPRANQVRRNAQIEGAKKQGNEDATMKRAREKSGTCDGTGTQAKSATVSKTALGETDSNGNQYATGETDGDGNQYGTDETNNDGKNARPRSILPN